MITLRNFTTYNEWLLQLFQAPNQTTLQQLAMRMLVEYFQFEATGVYKQIGPGKTYTLRVKEVRGKVSMPDDVQFAGPVALSTNPFVISEEHPVPFLFKDTFQKGQTCCGILDQAGQWLLMAHSNQQRISDFNEFQLFWYTLIHRFQNLKGHTDLGNVVADNSPGYQKKQSESIELEKLRRANEELGQFASRASHDLQEPLRTISNYITLFYKKYGDQLSPEGAEFLGFAKNASERMHKMIRDLLLISRLENGNENKKYVHTELILQEALENLRLSAEEKGAIIIYRELPSLIGYEKQILSLFQNLLENAIKFSGDQKPFIQIEAEAVGKGWEFSFADNGIGIAAAAQEHIFQPFKRLHGSGDYGGSGLGLAICKKVVENHQGNIQVMSQEGRGSKFIFQICNS